MREMIRTLVLSTMMLVLPSLAQAQAPGQNEEKYIVTFRPGTAPALRAAVVARFGGAVRHNFSIIDAVAVRIPNGLAGNLLTAVSRDPSVLSITTDHTVYAFQDANSFRGNAAQRMSATAWTRQVVPEGVKRVGLPVGGVSDGAGIGVAIVDTGIDLSNADLAANIHPDKFVSPGMGTTSCQDNNGHGTHVSGIVAAIDNQIGTVGVAPRATLYCVKVLDASGTGSDSDVIAGLDWVLQHAAIRVVNMSLGRPVSTNPAADEPMHAAVKRLNDAGITLVVAAGNDSSKQVSDMVPASFSEVLPVASTSAIDGTNFCPWLAAPIKADTASYFTTDGAGVVISAPGEDQENVSGFCYISTVGILSTRRGGGTIRMSGTSMASPHVAGVAVRMIQQHAAWRSDDVRAELQRTAQRKETAPLDSPASSYTFDKIREGIAKAP